MLIETAIAVSVNVSGSVQPKVVHNVVLVVEHLAELESPGNSMYSPLLLGQLAQLDNETINNKQCRSCS